MNQADQLPAARGSSSCSLREHFILFLQISAELYRSTESKSSELHIYKETCEVKILDKYHVYAAGKYLVDLIQFGMKGKRISFKQPEYEKFATN